MFSHLVADAVHHDESLIDIIQIGEVSRCGFIISLVQFLEQLLGLWLSLNDDRAIEFVNFPEIHRLRGYVSILIAQLCEHVTI